MEKIVALILPPIIDLINVKVPDRRVRFLVSFAVCSALGIALHAARNGILLGFEEVSTDILSVFALSQISYALVYKNSNLEDMMLQKG